MPGSRALLNFAGSLPVVGIPLKCPRGPLSVRPLSVKAMKMKMSPPDHAYSVAPMMDVTDRHWRVMARLISQRATLYTEMVVDRTLIYNPRAIEFELRLPPLPRGLSHQPVVLQLGGSVPEELEAAAKIAADFPYSEVNLNCGCPSPKVAGKGCFGAALMRTPGVVAAATRRMSFSLPSDTPVTVKCRIGVDDDDSYEHLADFVRIVSQDGGVKHFIVHARKAILGGLSPAQNRSIPPLRHEVVYQLRNDFPGLIFSINGGIRSIDDVSDHLERGVHGVMVGRGCMDSPWLALSDVDMVVYGDQSRPTEGPLALTRRNVLRDYAEYAEQEVDTNGCPSRILVRPLLNLFHGEPKGKIFRRAVDELLRDKSLSVRDVIERASSVLPDFVLDKLPASVEASSNELQRDMRDFGSRVLSDGHQHMFMRGNDDDASSEFTPPNIYEGAASITRGP